MVKISHSVASKKRKKRVLRQAKGHYAQKHKRFRQAKRSVIKAMVYSYRDRKVRKREFRHLWIARINAACRAAGISYSRFIKGLTDAKVAINRKMLAEMAVSSPETFRQIVGLAKEAQPRPSTRDK